MLVTIGKRFSDTTSNESHAVVELRCQMGDEKDRDIGSLDEAEIFTNFGHDSAIGIPVPSAPKRRTQVSASPSFHRAASHLISSSHLNAVPGCGWACPSHDFLQSKLASMDVVVQIRQGSLQSGRSGAVIRRQTFCMQHQRVHVRVSHQRCCSSSWTSMLTRK